MICDKCGHECSDGVVFCDNCGAELDIPVLPENVDDNGNVKGGKKKKIKKPEKPPKPIKEKKQRTEEEMAALKKKLKIGGAALAAITLITVIVLVLKYVESNKGLTAVSSIPLGRDVTYASAESGLEFSQQCDNGIVNGMTDFDFICTSDKNVKVCGSEQPEWSVMLTTGNDGMITSVEYYDFSQLELNWKGRKSPAKLDQNSLEFGMNVKNVSRTLGFKPYYIKRNVNNDAVYCYRYYYYDEESGCDRAFNYYVEFSDVDSTVKNVRYSEIDYAGVILAANEKNTAIGDIDTETEPIADEEAAETDTTESITE